MIYIRLPLFLFAFILLLSNSLFAQDGKGKVRIYTKMNNSVIEIDGQKVAFGEWVVLDTGKHEVTAQAVGHIKATEQFILKEGAQKTVPVQLEPTKEFLIHTTKLKKGKRKKALLKSGPIILYSVYGGYSLFQLYLLDRDARDNFKNAEEARVQHSNSFWKGDLDRYSKEFEASKEAYSQNKKDIRTQWALLASATAVTATITYFTRKAANNIELPQFSEKSKLTNISVSPILSPGKSGIYLSYTF